MRGVRDPQAPDPAPPQAFPPGIRYMAMGAFFFSIMSLLVKSAGQRLPTQEVVFARAAITLALSYWGVLRAGVPIWGRNRPLLVTRGVLGYVALSCFYFAIINLPLADATVIQYTNPVFAALLAVWVLGERLQLGEVLAVVVSLFGVVLVMRPGFIFGAGAAGGLDPLAVGIGLVGAVGSAAAYVTVRRLRATEHPMVIVFYFALTATVLSFPFAISDALWPTPFEWLVLLGVGISTQLGQVAITRGLHLERAGRATGVGYLQIVFAAIWGIVFFAEYLDLGTIAGASLIVGSTLALARRPVAGRAGGG